MDNPKVLIVDDEEDLRMAVSGALAGEYQILEARNGIEAAEILKKEPVDVVLLDIRMPELGGMDLLEVIPVIALDEDTAVVMVTAVNEVAVAVDAIKAGAFDYIVKPIKYKELHEKLRSALAYKMGVKELKENLKKHERKLEGSKYEQQQKVQSALSYIELCKREGKMPEDKEINRRLGFTTY